MIAWVLRNTYLITRATEHWGMVYFYFGLLSSDKLINPGYLYNPEYLKDNPG